MNSERLAHMVDRVAGLEDAPGGTKDPVEVVDESVDNIIAAIEAIGEALPQVDVSSAEESAAVEKIKDLMETAIAPYMVDVAKAMDVFVGSEE